MRRCAAALLMLILIGIGRGHAQVFRAMAFGDSITQGVPFDDQRAETCDPSSPGIDPDFCGYSVRLSESGYYDCAANSCFFDNRGRAGESTSAGLTRIDRELGNRHWDLVIVMEGTNDISKGMSLETVQFNLAELARKAEARSAAAVQASTIWFKPSFARPELAAMNDAGDMLRDAIAEQAAASKRCFVDARSRLCPPGAQQASCLASNYWAPPPGEVDPVGHPNSQGFDELAEEFFAVLGSPGPPGAAEPVSPIDEEICSADLVIEWEHEQIAESECGNWYYVEIEGPKRTEFSGWISEAETCSGKSCAFAPPVNLSRGDYSFRLQTRNTAGLGPLTDDASFSALRNEPEAVSGIIGPRGPIFSAGGSSEPFEWSSVKDARSYRLEVVSGKGRVVLDESISAEDACVDAICSFASPTPLEADRYTWRVRAENVCGGSFSTPVVFEVFGGAPASAPLTAGPTGRVYDPAPTLRWEAVSGATEYDIERPSGAVTTVAATDACVGGFCRLAAASLAPGLHSWRVRAVNPLGPGPWSASISFELVSCDCVRAGTAGGASVLLAVPAAWNGDLVIWAHGSNPFGVREFTDLGPLADRQFDEGYALATTSYSVTGWPLFKSKRDLEKLLSQFTSRFGEPSRVYLVGESAGALAAAAGLEKARLGNAVGALALCAPTDFRGTWEAALDLRLAYDAVCAEVPGTTIAGGAEGLSENHGLEPRDIAAAVNLCTGLSKNRANRSRAQASRLDALLSVTQIREQGLLEAMELATFGLFDLVSDKRKLRGGVPVGNDGVVYPSPELDLTIARVKSDRRARRKLERFSTLSGRVGDARIVSLHTSSDPVFFVENQTELAALVPPENLVTATVVENGSSQCGLSEAEILTGWRTLVDWTETDIQPTVREIERRCSRLRSTASGECRFDSRYELQPMSTRVAPRP